MTKEKFRKNTMIEYDRHWKRMAKYAEIEGTMYFTMEFVNHYLKDVFNYPEDRPTRSCHASHIRAFKKLIEIYLHGYTLKRSHSNFHVVPDEFKAATEAYENHCKRRNNTEETIKRGKNYLNNFYAFLLKKDIHDLNKITAKDISEFIICTLPYSKKSVYRNLRFLKGLFRALYFEELTEKDFSKEMPKLYFNDADFSPPIWSKDEINRILDAVDQGSPIGKRDYVMLLLVARTGIRNSDLRRLKLTDINWDTKEISFEQYKTKQPLTLPLLEDVGWAIIEYL